MVNSIFEFGDIWKEDKGCMLTGKLKLTDQNIVFKNAKTGKVDNIGHGDVEGVSWQRLAAGYGLRVTMNNGIVYRFGGFNSDEKEVGKLKDFFKEYYERDMKTRDLSLTGRNWGVVNFDSASLEFDIEKNNAFEVPLSYVSNCATAKNEVTLEFHQNDDASINLMEMRFFIPTDANSDIDPVEAFKKNVLSKASIIQATGDAIANFSDIQCLTPRGRYDIKIFSTFIQLHGKTFDYKIPVNTILRIFLLPHKDNRQVHVMLSLDPPIKQGQTRYHFLILLFNKEEEEDISLSMSEKDIKEKYDGKLEKEMSGPVFESLCRIVKAVVQRKVTTPGDYRSKNGTPAISCTYKSSYGFLYPLEKGFIYIHKPPVHIRFEEISSVNFARTGGNTTRSFDIEVELRNQMTYTFSSIEKDEYGRLYEFVKSKNLKIGKKQRGEEQTLASLDDMLDSDQDDDAAPDAYLHRVKNEAKARDDDDDDDEDESDDDFNPDKASGGSDVAEEYDTEHDSSSSDEDGEEGEDGAKKKKKHKTITIRESASALEKKPRKPKDASDKKKKGKKVKDKNAPKRPQTAYFLWMAENRERIKKENPGLSVTEIAKKGGEEWKNVSDKSKWEKENERLMEKWKKDVAEYQANKKSDDDEDEDEEDTKSPRKKSPKKSSSSKAASTSGGSGAGFKSKEYISSSGSEKSDGESKKTKKKSESKKKKKQESDNESANMDEEEILDSPEASGSEDGSDEESMDED